MSKLMNATLYEAAKSAAWTAWASGLLAKAARMGANSFSAFAEVLKEVKNENE